MWLPTLKGVSCCCRFQWGSVTPSVFPGIQGIVQRALLEEQRLALGLYPGLES